MEIVKKHSFLSMFTKYILVGLANTGLTAIIIFVLMWLGVHFYISNVLGYIAGILLSFTLNSIFTFSKKMSKKTLCKFLVACLISYVFNLLAINVFLRLFPTQLYLAQVAGMVCYTIVGFVLNKKWVMK